MRRLAFALAAIGLLAFASFAVASSIKEYGVDNAEQFSKPGCPQAHTCQAIGQVTGYQTRIGKTKDPFVIRRKGKIVAFTIALSKPSKSQVRFFSDLYGSTPKARISVLKLTNHNRKGKLIAQSGAFNLKPYLGSTPTFALAKPLRITHTSVIALTVPTWAPAFTVHLPNSYRWRASRSSSSCGDVEQQAAHEKVKTTRAYGCAYKTARMLYSVSFVPNPKPTSGTSKK